MENDIEYLKFDFDKSVNISEIGKYGKFVDFNKLPFEYTFMSLFPINTPFAFHTNQMTKEKLESGDLSTAIEDMQGNLDKCIEEELKKDKELQGKIEIIQIKAKKRIEKLREKPLDKLRKKYNYHCLEDYFVNLKPKQEISVEFSSSEVSTESSP